MNDITVITGVGPYPHNVRWLEECLNSVQAQSLPAFEHILVDDGANLDLPDRGLRIIKPPERIGSSCINLGIEAAETEWVTVLNSDDYYFEHAIKRLTGAIVSAGDLNYIRFPVNCSDGTASAAGQLFKKEVWEKVGRYQNNQMLDYWFIDNVIRMGIAVYDLQMDQIYFHRYHKEQMSITGLFK